MIKMMNYESAYDNSNGLKKPVSPISRSSIPTTASPMKQYRNDYDIYSSRRLSSNSQMVNNNNPVNHPINSEQVPSNSSLPKNFVAKSSVIANSENKNLISPKRSFREPIRENSYFNQNSKSIQQNINDNESFKNNLILQQSKPKYREENLNEKISHSQTNDPNIVNSSNQPKTSNKLNKNFLTKMKKKYKNKISANISGTKFDISNYCSIVFFCIRFLIL